MSHASAPTPEPADDSGRGEALVILFVSAVLAVTCAVAFLALLGSWWVLGVAFAMDVLVTTVVGVRVFTVLGDGKLISRPTGPGQAER